MAIQTSQSQTVGLNESTAVLRTILISLFDTTSAEVTGLTFSGSEIQVSKNGGAFANFAGTMTEVGLGVYAYELDSTEIDTLGSLIIRVLESGGGHEETHVKVQVLATSPYVAIADTIIEGTLTLEGFLRIIGAVCAGEVSGAATTSIVIKSMENNAKTRVTATVDAQGNRDTVVIDETD